MTGKHSQSEPPPEGAPYDLVPDLTTIAVGAANAKGKAAGGTYTVEHDKTEVPVEIAMWTKMRSTMHGIADVTDIWERFAKSVLLRQLSSISLTSI